MKLATYIESLLFVSLKPLNAKKIAEFVDASVDDIQEALDTLQREYVQQERGIQLIKNNGKYKMVTHPDTGEVTSQFLKEDVIGELTGPQLETLTVIAYRMPVTKAELELIRGVNCSMILRNLLIRGLIEEKQDTKSLIPVYVLSFECMQHLGITKQEDLPDFEKLNSDENLQSLLEQQTSSESVEE